MAALPRIHNACFDDELVDFSQQALRSWAQFLGVPEAEFRKAAEQVGPRLRDIRQHLIGGFTTAGPTS
jgi:hypothetical protein